MNLSKVWLYGIWEVVPTMTSDGIQFVKVMLELDRYGFTPK